MNIENLLINDSIIDFLPQRLSSESTGLDTSGLSLESFSTVQQEGIARNLEASVSGISPEAHYLATNRVYDAAFATESADLSRFSVLFQVSQSILQQANTVAQDAIAGLA